MKTFLTALPVAACGLALALALPAQGAPMRIVTLAAPVTETVFALGAGPRVVGADLSSEYPEAARALPKIGYHRAISSEGVLSLRPDLVLGTEDAGPPAALRQLRDAGVRVVLVPAEPSPQGARAKIAAVAEALGDRAAAAPLLAALDRDLDSARTWIAARGNATENPKPRVLFIYARGQGALSVSGRGTAADAMIALAGGVNAVDGYEGYKPLTPEALATARPDAIVLTTTGLASAGGAEGILRQPGVALTPAGRAGRILAFDDELLLGFGPRLGHGVLALARGIHAHAPESSRPATRPTTPGKQP